MTKKSVMSVRLVETFDGERTVLSYKGRDGKQHEFTVNTTDAPAGGATTDTVKAFLVLYSGTEYQIDGVYQNPYGGFETNVSDNAAAVAAALMDNPAIPIILAEKRYANDQVFEVMKVEEIRVLNNDDDMVGYENYPNIKVMEIATGYSRATTERNHNLKLHVVRDAETEDWRFEMEYCK